MNIGIPIPAYEEGTTGEYVKRAFIAKGHDAEIISQYQMYDALADKKYDLLFCVDSGGALNLAGANPKDWARYKNTAFWLIDYRRGKELKHPNDRETARLIGLYGGGVFQAQFEDVEDCFLNGINSKSWLPL